MNVTDCSEVLTVSEIAKILKVNAQMVRNLIGRGQLKAFIVGHGFRVKRADFQAFMDSQYAK